MNVQAVVVDVDDAVVVVAAVAAASVAACRLWLSLSAVVDWTILPDTAPDPPVDNRSHI